MALASSIIVLLGGLVAEQNNEQPFDFDAVVAEFSKPLSDIVKERQEQPQADPMDQYINKSYFNSARVPYKTVGSFPASNRSYMQSLQRQNPSNTSPGLSTGLEDVFARMVQAESRGKHRDASGALTTSPVGAEGIAQLMPATQKDPGYGVAPLKNDSEAENLRFGKDLFRAYTRELGGDIRAGVAAYNHGIGAVQRLIKANGDAWESKLPAETKKYLKKVLG